MGCGPILQSYKAVFEPILVILYIKMQIVGGSPYQVNLIINVTMSMDPLTVKFDAFQVLPYGDLHSQKQLSEEHKYLCPEPVWGMSGNDPHQLPCSSWAKVWWITQYGGYTAEPHKAAPTLAELKDRLSLTRGGYPEMIVGIYNIAHSY